jgi:hypothetical protein
MATQAEQVAAGDLDEDGTDDLIGLWTTQGGVWVKYSRTGSWLKLSSPAADIDAGVMRGAFWGSNKFEFTDLLGPFGGLAEGPLGLSRYKDLAGEGPGGWRFAAQEERNLVPTKKGESSVIPGPGEPGFLWLEQKNLIPEETTATAKPPKADRKREKREGNKTARPD